VGWWVRAQLEVPIDEILANAGGKAINSGNKPDRFVHRAACSRHITPMEQNSFTSKSRR
jgi:hypothetical protein